MSQPAVSGGKVFSGRVGGPSGWGMSAMSLSNSRVLWDRPIYAVVMNAPVLDGTSTSRPRRGAVEDGPGERPRALEEAHRRDERALARRGHAPRRTPRAGRPIDGAAHRGGADCRGRGGNRRESTRPSTRRVRRSHRVARKAAPSRPGASRGRDPRSSTAACTRPSATRCRAATRTPARSCGDDATPRAPRAAPRARQRSPNSDSSWARPTACSTGSTSTRG